MGESSSALMGFLYIPIFYDIWGVLVALRLLWYPCCGFRMAELSFWAVITQKYLWCKLLVPLLFPCLSWDMFNTCASSSSLLLLSRTLLSQIACLGNVNKCFLCKNTVHAIGAYLKWHSPEWFDHKPFFPDDLFWFSGQNGQQLLIDVLIKIWFSFQYLLYTSYTLFKHCCGNSLTNIYVGFFYAIDHKYLIFS